MSNLQVIELSHNYLPRVPTTIMLWQLIHIATIWPLLLQFSSVAKAQISSSVPRSLIVGIAHVANVVDYLHKELSLLGKHVHESGVDGRVGNVVVIIVIPTRAIRMVHSDSRTQIHPSKN
jgi:hypothetical protein